MVNNKNNTNKNIRDKVNEQTIKLNNTYYYELRIIKLTKNQNLEAITNQVSFLTNSINSMNRKHFSGIRIKLTDIFDQQLYILSELQRVKNNAKNVFS